MAVAHKSRNPEREQEIVKLRKEGLTFSQISERLGITPGTISYYLAKNEVAGAKEAKLRRYARKIAPIVYRAEQNGNVSCAGTLDDLFYSLSLDSKMAALKAVIEGRKS